MCWCNAAIRLVCCGGEACRIMCRQNLHRDTVYCKWCSPDASTSEKSAAMLPSMPMPQERVDPDQQRAEQAIPIKVKTKNPPKIRRPPTKEELEFKKVFNDPVTSPQPPPPSVPTPQPQPPHAAARH